MNSEKQSEGFEAFSEIHIDESFAKAYLIRYSLALSASYVRTCLQRSVRHRGRQLKYVSVAKFWRKKWWLLATMGQNGCSCGSRRIKNACLAVAPPPQRGHVTPSRTGTGRFVAAAKTKTHKDADVNFGTRRQSPTPPPFGSRRNRRPQLHGAFRRHQPEGQPHAQRRSKREKGAMWCVVSRDTAGLWFSGLVWAEDFAFGAGEGFVRERF